MTHYVFEEVNRTGFKTVPCAVCGRKLNRQRTFGMTLNPWNVNADGTQRSRREIHEALQGKIEAWQAEPETHTRCFAVSR